MSETKLERLIIKNLKIINFTQVYPRITNVKPINFDPGYRNFFEWLRSEELLLTKGDFCKNKTKQAFSEKAYEQKHSNLSAFEAKLLDIFQVKGHFKKRKYITHQISHSLQLRAKLK